MPLRTLLGEGEKEILKITYSKLNTSQIFLIGSRSLDKEENDFIRKKKNHKSFC